MIEFGSEPSTKVSASARSLLDNMNVAIKAASKEKTVMLPSSTYPGKFEPKMRSKGNYKIKKKLFGLQFPISGKCVGFHLHHALPEGSFDATSKTSKPRSVKKRRAAWFKLTTSQSRSTPFSLPSCNLRRFMKTSNWEKTRE